MSRSLKYELSIPVGLYWFAILQKVSTPVRTAVYKEILPKAHPSALFPSMIRVQMTMDTENE